MLRDLPAGLCPVRSRWPGTVEVRIDAHKMCREMRRPEPKGAQDIGSWALILEFMSTAAVFTNMALVLFTSKAPVFGVVSSYEGKVWLFFGLTVSGRGRLRARPVQLVTRARAAREPVRQVRHCPHYSGRASGGRDAN